MTTLYTILIEFNTYLNPEKTYEEHSDLFRFLQKLIITCNLTIETLEDEKLIKNEQNKVLFLRPYIVRYIQKLVYHEKIEVVGTLLNIFGNYIHESLFFDIYNTIPEDNLNLDTKYEDPLLYTDIPDRVGEDAYPPELEQDNYNKWKYYFKIMLFYLKQNDIENAHKMLNISCSYDTKKKLPFITILILDNKFNSINFLFSIHRTETLLFSSNNIKLFFKAIIEYKKYINSFAYSFLDTKSVFNFKSYLTKFEFSYTKKCNPAVILDCYGDTPLHSLYKQSCDISKHIYVKLFLDYYITFSLLLTRKNNEQKTFIDYATDKEKQLILLACEKDYHSELPNAIFKEIRKTCFYCNNKCTKILKCGKCRSIYYCSTKCSKKHWQEHKKICKEITGE